MGSADCWCGVIVAKQATFATSLPDRPLISRPPTIPNRTYSTLLQRVKDGRWAVGRIPMAFAAGGTAPAAS